MPVCLGCQHQFAAEELAAEDTRCPLCGGEIAAVEYSSDDVGHLVHPLRLLAAIYQDAQDHLSEPALAVRLSDPLAEVEQRLSELDPSGPALDGRKFLSQMTEALEAVQRRTDGGLVPARRRELERAKTAWLRADGLIRHADPKLSGLPSIPLEGPEPGAIAEHFMPEWLRLSVAMFLLLVAIMSIGLPAAGLFREAALAFSIGLVGFSAVWVWMDAKVKNVVNAGGWLALTIVAWPVAFPAYVAAQALNRLPFWSLAAGVVAMIAGLARVVPLWLATSVPALALGLLALAPSSAMSGRDKRPAIYGIGAALLALFVLPHLFPLFFSVPAGPGARIAMVLGAGLRFILILAAVAVFRLWKQLNA